jgi:hypothetical protein
MPIKGGRHTLQEERFIDLMARGDIEPAEAAKLAAYKSSGAASKLMDRPAVQAAIREREAAIVVNELLPLANRVLKTALTSDAVPWGAKMKAVDIVHKRAFADDAGGSGKAPSEMTPDELAAALDKLKSELADRSRPAVLDLEPVEEDNPKGNVFG